MVKTKLKFRALEWFEAHSGESFISYEEFKQAFLERFVKKNEEINHTITFWKIYLEGPKYNDIAMFIGNLKIHSENNIERFVETKRKVSEYLISEKIKGELDLVDKWLYLMKICEKYEDEINVELKKRSDEKKPEYDETL